MSNFIFSTEPPLCWQDLCKKQGNLFHSLEWQTLLKQSFSTNIIYGWNAEIDTGIAITIFKVGPFRIGYIGFPVGGILGEQLLDNIDIMALSKAYLPSSIHLLRFPVSAFNENVEINLDYAITPETAIDDLQSWDLSKMPKLNRDIKKANRSGLRVVDASRLKSQGQICFNLYKETIRRNDGSLRYNENYFNELISLSNKRSNLRCLLAFLNEKIIGFVVVGCHGETAYYLHGAMDPTFRKHCTSDRLLFEAIVWAKEKGMNCFNLMSSPSSQPTLIRYKEKWGGVTRGHKVYELPIKPLTVQAFKGSMWCYTHFNKLFT